MTLTTDQISQLSHGRIVAFKHDLSDETVMKLAEALSILPPNPKSPTNSKKKRQNNKTKWIEALTPALQAAWTTLTPSMQVQYLKHGRVKLGQRASLLGAVAQHPLETVDQPSGSARREDLWELSRKRLLVFDAELSENELIELAKTLRRLPCRPPRPFGIKARRNILKLWKKEMTEKQSEVWSSLNSNFQTQYLATGQVQLGRPPSGEKNIQPVGSATTEEIIKAVVRQADDQDWDINKIDWSST